MQFLRSVCYNSFQIPLCSIRFFTNRAKSVILFYSEVFFSQPSFSEFPIFELYKKLLTLTSVNYSATELPEHLNRGGIPPFSGCVHDTTTVYSFELYSYFYDFRCFQSGHGQFFFYSGYGEIFSQDIICTDSIRIIILVSISV